VKCACCEALQVVVCSLKECLLPCVVSTTEACKSVPTAGLTLSTMSRTSHLKMIDKFEALLQNSPSPTKLYGW
jgi:hypothetical protein